MPNLSFSLLKNYIIFKNLYSIIIKFISESLKKFYLFNYQLYHYIKIVNQNIIISFVPLSSI